MGVVIKLCAIKDFLCHSPIAYFNSWILHEYWNTMCIRFFRNPHLPLEIPWKLSIFHELYCSTQTVGKLSRFLCASKCLMIGIFMFRLLSNGKHFHVPVWYDAIRIESLKTNQLSIRNHQPIRFYTSQLNWIGPDSKVSFSV